MAPSFIRGGSGGRRGSFVREDGTPRTSAELSSVFRPAADAAAESKYAAKLAENKKSFAQGLKRLVESGALGDAWEIYEQNRGVFSPEELKAYGLDEWVREAEREDALGAFARKNKGGNPLGKAFRFGDTLTGGALSAGLELLDKPSQYSKLTIGELFSGDIKGAGSAVVASLNPVNYFNSDIKSRIRASGLDQNQDGRLENMREALGKDPQGGGRLLGAFDFAAEVLTDPTTYVSFGGSALAKAGLRKVATEFGEDVARQIAQRGLRKSLRRGIRDSAGREITEDMLTATFREAAQEEVKSEAARRAARKLRDKYGQETAAEMIAQRQMRAIARSGRSGVRLWNPITRSYHTIAPLYPGGRSLPGFAKYPWQVGREAADILEDVPPSGRTLNPDGSIVGVPEPVRESLENVDLARVPDVENPRIMRGDDIPEFGRVREVRPDGTAVIDLHPHLLSPTENISDVIRAPQRTAAESLPFADETFDQRLANRVTPEEAIRRVEAAPSSTGAGGYGSLVDEQLPRTPGVVHSPEDGLLGIRAADGTLEGYVMYTDDAIGTFENLSGRQGVGQELLDALEAQGVDVPALLANSDFTDAGRGSALKWLKGKAPAAPAAEAVDAFPPGSTLTAEGTETTFTVLGKTEDGQLVIQVDDPEALIPFKRTPPIKGNKTVQVNPNVTGAPDPPHKGRVVRRGQTTVTGIRRQDTIPGVGVVTAVDDEGRMFVRRPDVTLADDAERPSRLLTQGGDAPQRTVQEGLEFADETADQLAARSPGRQAAVEVGEEVPGVGRVTSVEGRRAVVQLDDRFLGSQGPDGFRFRQSRPVQQELFPEEPLRKASTDIPTTPDVPLRGGGASAPVRRGLGGILRESAPGRFARELFVPRTAVSDRFGRSVAQTLYENVEQSAARMSRNVNDMILQIGKVSDRAAKELSKGPGPALRELMPELADRKGYDAFNDLALGEFEGRINGAAVREALRSDGMENTVKALDAFADVAGRGADELTFARGGVEAAEGLFESTAPAPRILTEEGAKALRGNLTLKELLGIDTAKLRAGEDLSRLLDRVSPEVERLAADGAGTRVAEAALPGTSYARMPVREVNDELVRRLNLPEGTKLFEDDAMAQVALRSRTAFEAAAQTDLYERLAKETFDGENPMLMIVRSTDSPVAREKAERRAKDLGYKKIESNTGKQPMIGDVYGPPEIVDEIAKVQDLIVNDESLRRMSDFLTKWNGVWASQATVPLIFGTGFHSRNAIGNVINAFNGGLANPARFVEAGRIQRAVGRARARMQKDGIAFEKALEQEVKSPRVRRIINDMRNHGIMSEGFFADLTADELDSLLKHKRIRDWANPKNWPKRLEDNALISSGRKVGQLVEDNARVALYLDHYAKTGSVQQAANQVKKYLFDYADLTPFERRTMKAINRFYTFTRKNLAVQLYTLAMDPWRIKLAASAEHKFFDREGTDNAAIPEYARKEGYNLTNILGRSVAVDVDTPLDAAIEALDPIAQAISITPGLQHFVPPEYRSSGQELASSVFNFRAGGPIEMANFIVEQVTGVDTFTGADISDEKGRATWDRFLKAISPLYAKGRTTTDIVRGKKEGMDLRLSLLQSLVGLSVLPLTDRTTNQVAYVAAQEVQNVLADLRAQGIDVPTYSELVAVGLAPDLSGEKEETKGRWVKGRYIPPTRQRRSPEEAAQARVDKINAAREALGASPFRPEPQQQTQQRRRGGRIFSL